jgi:hypothetical protein
LLLSRAEVRCVGERDKGPRVRVARCADASHAARRRPATLASDRRPRLFGANILLDVLDRREGACASREQHRGRDAPSATLTASCHAQASHPLVTLIESRVTQAVSEAQALLDVIDCAPENAPAVSFVAAEPLQVVRYSVSQGYCAHYGECPVFAIAARLRVLTRVQYPFCLSQTTELRA